MARIRRAVVPAAGLGTRFLPATKAVPKELLPIVDRPMISYVMDEAVGAGIDEVVVVVAPGKGALRRHFAPDPALLDQLERSGKHDLRSLVEAETDRIAVSYVVQDHPRGLGNAVGVAREAVAGEPFVVLLPDEVIDAGLLSRMLEVFETHRALAVIGLVEVAHHEIAAYGSVDPEPVAPGLVRVCGIVEKPAPDEAPSRLATIGRYVFAPQVFDALDRVEPGVGNEIQLTDAIALLAAEGEVYGVMLEAGHRYDVGRKVDFVRANLEMALRRDDLATELWPWLDGLVRRPRG